MDNSLNGKVPSVILTEPGKKLLWRHGLYSFAAYVFALLATFLATPEKSFNFSLALIGIVMYAVVVLLHQLWWNHGQGEFLISSSGSTGRQTIGYLTCAFVSLAWVALFSGNFPWLQRPYGLWTMNGILALWVWWVILQVSTYTHPEKIVALKSTTRQSRRALHDETLVSPQYTIRHIRFGACTYPQGYRPVRISIPLVVNGKDSIVIFELIDTEPVMVPLSEQCHRTNEEIQTGKIKGIVRIINNNTEVRQRCTSTLTRPPPVVIIPGNEIGIVGNTFWKWKSVTPIAP
jgi:hypothetical protein